MDERLLDCGTSAFVDKDRHGYHGLFKKKSNHNILGWNRTLTESGNKAGVSTSIAEYRKAMYFKCNLTRVFYLPLFKMESQEAKNALYLKRTSPPGNEQWVSALRTKVSSPLTYCHIVPKLISPITSLLTGKSAWLFNSVYLA